MHLLPIDSADRNIFAKMIPPAANEKGG